MNLRQRLAKLYATVHTVSTRPVRKRGERYIFSQHQQVGERLRRCRQAAYGQLGPDAFRSMKDYRIACEGYARFVIEQKDAA